MLKNPSPQRGSINEHRTVSTTQRSHLFQWRKKTKGLCPALRPKPLHLLLVSCWFMKSLGQHTGLRSIGFSNLFTIILILTDMILKERVGKILEGLPRRYGHVYQPPKGTESKETQLQKWNDGYRESATKNLCDLPDHHYFPHRPVLPLRRAHRFPRCTRLSKRHTAMMSQ